MGCPCLKIKKKKTVQRISNEFECQKPKEEPKQIDQSKSLQELSIDLKLQGNQHYKEQQFQQALACYLKAIEIYDKDPAYFVNTALVYKQFKDWNNVYYNVIQDSTKALNLDSNNYKALNLQGIAMIQHYKQNEASTEKIKIGIDNLQKCCCILEEKQKSQKGFQSSLENVSLTLEKSKYILKLKEKEIAYLRLKKVEQILQKYKLLERGTQNPIKNLFFKIKEQEEIQYQQQNDPDYLCCKITFVKLFYENLYQLFRKQCKTLQFWKVESHMKIQ